MCPLSAKNNNNIINLSLHEQDFSIEASRTFTGSGHGKSTCDGLGAVVKSTARKYLLKQGPESAFSSAKDFYQFAFEKTGRTLSPMKSKVPIKPIDNLADNGDQNDLSDEETSAIHSHSTRSIEVIWLDEKKVEETFQKVLGDKMYNNFP